MNLNPSVMLGIVLIGAASLVGYNWIFLPKYAEVDRIETQMGIERETQQAQAEVAATLKELEDLRKRLPPDDDASWLTREVLEIAQKAAIQVSHIQQQPMQTYQGFIRYSLKLSFSATYHTVGKFTDALERDEHFFRIERLSVKREQDAGDPPMIEMVLSTIYVPAVIASPSRAMGNPSS